MTVSMAIVDVDISMATVVRDHAAIPISIQLWLDEKRKHKNQQRGGLRKTVPQRGHGESFLFFSFLSKSHMSRPSSVTTVAFFAAASATDGRGLRPLM